jgi:Ca2+/Na+ antiporter
MKIWEVLKNIREFFWPILEPLEPVNIEEITIEDCKFDESEIEFELKILKELKKNEDERRKDVESKATIFIGTFIVAVTLLINLIKEFVLSKNNQASFLNDVAIILLSLTIIYLCQAIKYSIKTIEKRNYTIVGFPKFMLSNKLDKKRMILVKQYNALKKNQEQINIKVDYMTMTHEFFKRAVYAVTLFTFIFLLNYIYTDMFFCF